jgi:hypothetical protein
MGGYGLADRYLSNDHTVWTFVSEPNAPDGGAWEQLTTESCTQRDCEFVQIAAKNNVGYALDECGVVWYKDAADGTGVGCWAKLGSCARDVISIATDNCSGVASAHGVWGTFSSHAKSPGGVFSATQP